MKCPSCTTAELAPLRLESNLMARTCADCLGYWISGRDYYDWLHAHRPGKQEPFTEVSLNVTSSSNAKLCPECGKIMMKYKVGHGMNFTLDHCTSCGSVWLDRNEWEILKRRHLHDELHRIFSTKWGREVLRDESTEHLDKIYATRLGEQDYAEIVRIRNWLRNHPQRALMLSFLAESEHQR